MADLNNLENAAPLKRFLRIKEVEKAVGLRKSSIYSKVAERTFPAPVPLGDAPNSPNGWPEDEIALWQANRLAKRAAKHQ
jgi:prophage regulatory protein